MKKFFSLISMVMLTVSVAIAQNSEKLKFDDVLNNRFGDNWELAVAGGHTFSAYKGWGQGPFMDNFGWNVEATTTKWFNPIVGARVQVAAGQVEARTAKSWMITPHVDAVVNLSNWIGGYKDDRVYYAKLFAGTGMHVVDVNNGASYGAVGTAGLINTFRVSPCLDINLELKGYVMETDDMQRVCADTYRYGKLGQIYNATVGLAYRFGKRDWERGVPAVDAANYLKMIEVLNHDLDRERNHTRHLAERMRKYDDALKHLAHENKMLHDQIKNHKCNANVVTTSTVFFDINSAKLCDRSKVSLDLLADVIKNSPDAQVFTVVGHADSATGTAAYNQKLSEKRAKAVYEYLVNAGVAKEKLQYVGKGGVDMFKVTNTNRVTIVR